MYAVLRGIKHGNQFFTIFDPEKDSKEELKYSAEGELWYDVLKIVNTTFEAWEVLYGTLEAHRLVKQHAELFDKPESHYYEE
jgi:hypothetical protein